LRFDVISTAVRSNPTRLWSSEVGESSLKASSAESEI
jgi:hypothetical protein